MKRYGNLFDQIFSIDNLFQAYLEARKGKSKKPSCHQFSVNVGYFLNNIRNDILSDNYKIKPYTKFFVYEPKKREIHAPWFGDIVVQHAIYRIIRPIFEKTFIHTSFACRKGKGTHKASEYTQKILQSSNPENYTLKMDISKFFRNIDRTILSTLFEKKIKDKRLLKLMNMFSVTDSPTGIPIGNLLSQLYSLIYMNGLDNFVKRNLKIKKYCRYVDDFILFDLSFQDCKLLKNKIELFLDDTLKLCLSKFSFQKIKNGINFVGYRTYIHKKLLRKYTLHKFKRKVLSCQVNSVVSIIGHSKHTSSLRYLLKYLSQNWTMKSFNPLHHIKFWFNKGFA